MGQSIFGITQALHPLTWYWYCPHKPHSPTLLPKPWAQISFDIWLTFQNICLPLLLPFFCFFLSPLLSLRLIGIKAGEGGVRNCSSLFLRTKVGQARLCPRNMWRLIQFARACRSCKYLWATEKELTQAHRLKEAGRGLAKHQWPQMLLPGRQVQLATRGASLLGGRWQECGKSILASGAAEFFSLPFLYPQPISNFQPLGGFRDQFSSQKLPTPPIRLLLAWMTDLYFWGEETYAHPLLPTSAILSSVRKHQGMHNFSHLCTQAHASCFKV